MKLTKLVDSLHLEFQKSQYALDKYIVHAYVQKLISFGRNQSLSGFVLKKILPFHYYQASLKISFQAYSLKQHPELIHLRRPCVIMRLLKKWEKKLITINILTTGSPSRNKCILLIDGKPVKNYFHNNQRQSN